jgi:hypothetical protein
VPPDRPRLWESVRRALGGAPTESPAEPEPGGNLAPPFLPDEEPVTIQPAPVPARPVEASAAPAAEAVSPPVSTEPPPAASEAPAPRGPRLARGLASFSRANADREKKFRHILSDGDPEKKK